MLTKNKRKTYKIFGDKTSTSRHNSKFKIQSHHIHTKTKLNIFKYFKIHSSLLHQVPPPKLKNLVFVAFIASKKIIKNKRNETLRLTFSAFQTKIKKIFIKSNRKE